MTQEQLDQVLADYLAAKAEKTAAEKREKALAALILEHAHVTDPETRMFFETDMFRVDIEPGRRTGLDLAALRKDFPGIEKDYGKVSVWSKILPRPKEAAAADPGQDQKSA